MKKIFTAKLIATQAIFLPATNLFAHDGHGMQGSHWHASDATGFVVLIVMIALTIWLSHGGK